MSGIIYPKNWREVIETTKVIETELRNVGVKEVEVEISTRLVESIDLFGGAQVCLALSGGLDSSVLAVLLKKIGGDFTAITIGSSENHPDIVLAKSIAEQFQLKHLVSILIPPRQSEDIYDDLFGIIAKMGFKKSIHADCIDEMIGGYWEHQRPSMLKEYRGDVIEEKRRWIFEDFWQRLIPEHLQPMDMYASGHGISVALPYLAAHNLLRSVGIEQRVNDFARKIILRELAEELGIPDEIINRKKLGLCSAWDTF